MSKPELVISLDELRDLPEYSCTIPTGATPGKRWRRATPYTSKEPYWLIGEYVDIGSPDEIGIRWYWAVNAPGCVHRGRL